MPSVQKSLSGQHITTGATLDAEDNSIDSLVKFSLPIHAKVVILEDNSELCYLYADFFHSFGWKTVFAENIDSVRNEAENTGEYLLYIFDVDLGRDRNTEGLDALDLVKEIDHRNFVVVLSSFEKYLKLAKEANLRLDKTTFINPTESIEKTFFMISSHYMHHCSAISQAKENDQNLAEEFLLNSTSKNDCDKNLSLYQQLLKDSNWLKSHQGKCIGIVDGELKLIDDDLQSLVNTIEACYPLRQRFFAQVTSHDLCTETIEMSTAMTYDLY